MSSAGFPISNPIATLATLLLSGAGIDLFNLPTSPRQLVRQILPELVTEPWSQNALIAGLRSIGLGYRDSVMRHDINYARDVWNRVSERVTWSHKGEPPEDFLIRDYDTRRAERYRYVAEVLIENDLTGSLSARIFTIYSNDMMNEDELADKINDAYFVEGSGRGSHVTMVTIKLVYRNQNL